MIYNPPRSAAIFMWLFLPAGAEGQCAVAPPLLNPLLQYLRLIHTKLKLQPTGFRLASNWLLILKFGVNGTMLYQYNPLHFTSLKLVGNQLKSVWSQSVANLICCERAIIMYTFAWCFCNRNGRSAKIIFKKRSNFDFFSAPTDGAILALSSRVLAKNLNLSVADPGGGGQGGHGPPPRPVKNRPKKDGRRAWRLICHVSWPPSPKFLDPLLIYLPYLTYFKLFTVTDV